jgi:acyl carrier protein
MEADMRGKTLAEEEKQEIYNDIREFLSEELDVAVEDIGPDSKILDDLGGDSMIYLELVEEFKKKFDIVVEVRVLGQYFQKNPVYTVGETAQAVYDLIERGEELLKSED